MGSPGRINTNNADKKKFLFSNNIYFETQKSIMRKIKKEGSNNVIIFFRFTVTRDRTAGAAALSLHP